MTNIDWIAHYYLLNNFWVYYNLICIVPFVVACINRYRNPEIETHLFTDHVSRIFLLVPCIYYVFETVVKYVVDGGDSICQKAVFIHHIVSLFIILPLVLNRYVPWWANPIGFLHGFLVFFPDFELLNYAYAVAILYFQFSLYQKPFDKFPYYSSTRIAINGIWVFAVYLLIGDCSNFLPLRPD
jgi:hypothetical protein